jgi:hypothetical protein
MGLVSVVECYIFLTYDSLRNTGLAVMWEREIVNTSFPRVPRRVVSLAAHQRMLASI